MTPATEQAVSPDAARARAFLAYCDSAVTGTHDAAKRDAMKQWIWQSVKAGYHPALLPDTTYRPEADDAE